MWNIDSAGLIKTESTGAKGAFRTNEFAKDTKAGEIQKDLILIPGRNASRIIFKRDIPTIVSRVIKNIGRPLRLGVVYTERILYLVLGCFQGRQNHAC